MILCKAKNTAKTIVISDLDGTLLDHTTYSYDDALPALQFLKANDIPLILASSKTVAEIIELRKELGFQHCEAIVENGAGILEPGAHKNSDFTTHQKLMNALTGLPNDLRCCFQGFSDWDVSEVVAKTGLTEESAVLAKKRQFSEPGLWFGDNNQFLEFQIALQAEDVSIQQGGRFATLSFGNDKADQFHVIKERYETAGGKVIAIALGDALNDIGMLEAADLGIIIPNPAHAAIPTLSGEKNGDIVRADITGPEGWSKSLLSALTSLYNEE